MLARREDKVWAGTGLVESQIEKPFPSRLPHRLQHPPKLPMAPPPHIEVLLSIYPISFSSPPLRSHYLAHLVSSKWRWQSSKNLNFIVGNPEAAWGVCFKAARGLGLGIFCGVWRSKIYLEVRSPQITKTQAGKSDAGESIRKSKPGCVLDNSQIRLRIIASFNSVPPKHSYQYTSPSRTHTKVDFLPVYPISSGDGKTIAGIFYDILTANNDFFAPPLL